MEISIKVFVRVKDITATLLPPHVKVMRWEVKKRKDPEESEAPQEAKGCNLHLQFGKRQPCHKTGIQAHQGCGVSCCVLCLFCMPLAASPYFVLMCNLLCDLQGNHPEYSEQELHEQERGKGVAWWTSWFGAEFGLTSDWDERDDWENTHSIDNPEDGYGPEFHFITALFDPVWYLSSLSFFCFPSRLVLAYTFISLFWLCLAATV